MAKESKVVYHYTSQDGFYGIITNSTLWASNIIYQNDENEFYIGKTLITQLSYELFKSNNEKIDYFEFEKLIDASLYDNAICAISFSRERNSLNQFRNYGKTFPGYALGFNSETLIESITNKKILAKIVDCIYTNDLVVEEIKDQIKKIYQETFDERDITNYCLTLAAKIVEYSPKIKDDCFYQEQERRLVVNYINPVRNLYKFRKGKSYFVPYLEIPIDLNNCLEEIIVGPSPNTKLAYTSTKAFFENAKSIKNISRIKINESGLPYREW